MMKKSKTLALIITSSLVLGLSTSFAASKSKKDPEERKEELLQKFDADGDGKLSETERAAATADGELSKKMILKKFDKDGDGTLSVSEKEAMKAAKKAKTGKTAN